MAFDLVLFGSKLKRYRKQFKASLDEVSMATGIPTQDLIAILKLYVLEQYYKKNKILQFLYREIPNRMKFKTLIKRDKIIRD